MNELYWITRFSYFHSLAMIFMILGFIGITIFLILYYINNAQAIYERSKERENLVKEYEGYRDTCLKSLRLGISMTVIFTLVFLFVPTTKDALIIYGIGGTVDYLKENPTAKQLPDKCVKALDKWVDSFYTKNDSIK